MPEFVAGGPTIPVRLLNELDTGSVVFFCGAGISEGGGSGLPGFADLVEYVYEVNSMEPDAVEKEALDFDEPVRSRRRPNFDKALGFLERPERLGPQALRSTVIERLAALPTGELAMHNKALIVLSRNERGLRLITTNFEAGLEGELIDTAPKLPVPKPHSWSSLVHLHGRIGLNEGEANLILTAADFGRAYLTERWAARFVTELFREFTVVFVGYSVGDPVMGYMVDALAAERVLGARFATAYAFAGEDDTCASKVKASDGWRAKNVEPILYDKRDGHRLLAETLIEWARIRNDPFFARSRIAINEITKMPAGPDDPVVERVIWALQYPVAAKVLADELEGCQAQYQRVPRLLTELRIAHGEGTIPKLYRDLGRIELLILDDWGLAPIDTARARDLLEILDDRVGRRSVVVTSQLPVADWHRQLNDPTLADAILDRLVHAEEEIAKGELPTTT